VAPYDLPSDRKKMDIPLESGECLTWAAVAEAVAS
jgi:hypothetical protein